jgi:hypothetical protein
MRCGTALISGCSLSSTLVYHNLGNFVLCVNLTTNSGELNSWKETGVTPQLFRRRSCVRQDEADGATAGEINA